VNSMEFMNSFGVVIAAKFGLFFPLNPPAGHTRISADPPAAEFGCILADPPWPYATYSVKGQGRSATAPYDTMSLDDVRALPVGRWAAPDCVLFLWVTKPQLVHAPTIISDSASPIKPWASPGSRAVSRLPGPQYSVMGSGIGPAPIPNCAYWRPAANPVASMRCRRANRLPAARGKSDSYPQANQSERDLLGAKRAKRTRQAKSPPPMSPRQRLVGKVSLAPSPKRVLPTAVGSRPDPELIKLFDNADGLGECNNRLKVARPELTEAERFALLRAHFAVVNTKWLASGKGGARKELARLASRNPSGFYLDYVDNGPKVSNDD
jgi:hypothetical protein